MPPVSRFSISIGIPFVEEFLRCSALISNYLVCPRTFLRLHLGIGGFLPSSTYTGLNTSAFTLLFDCMITTWPSGPIKTLGQGSSILPCESILGLILSLAELASYLNGEGKSFSLWTYLLPKVTLVVTFYPNFLEWDSNNFYRNSIGKSANSSHNDDIEIILF